MPIDVAHEVGSREFVDAIRAHNIRAELVKLNSADFRFTGHGRKGEVRIGVERKTVGDLLDCIHSKRFSDIQARRMVEDYDYRYLFVEGEMRANPYTGILQTNRRNKKTGKWGWYDWGMGRAKPYAVVVQYLNSVTIQAGFDVRRTRNSKDTVEELVQLFRWWQKPWEEHRTFKGLHATQSPYMELTKPTRMVRILKELPGIDWELAKRLEKEFGCVRDVALASVEVLQEVEGIGAKKAQGIYDAFRKTRYK